VASVWETTGVGAMGPVSPKGEEGKAEQPVESDAGGWDVLLCGGCWMCRSSYLKVGRGDGEVSMMDEKSDRQYNQEDAIRGDMARRESHSAGRA
jgi:hypothetical protein